MRWLFAPLPSARVAWLRRAVYAFVVLDVLALHTSGHYHGWADPFWYRPLWMGRLLHLPPASVLLVEALRWTCVAAAALAVLGQVPPRVRQVAAWAVAVSWIWYQYVAFAYGKVDHDRADFAIALIVLPLAGAAITGDRRWSQAAGYALRVIQLTAIATYFLSAWAKVRFGGWEWVNSATMVRAVVRRGSWLGDQLLHVPWSLHAFQWVLLSLELLSPLIFVVAERWRRRMVGGWYLFHLATYATIGIAFYPHLVMMLAFLPLETYADRVRSWWAARTGDPAVLAAR